MKKNKLKDIITCVKLMRYGMNVKACLGTMLLFMTIGIVFEFMNILGMVGYRNALWMDFGALFLYSAAMYPAQILMTLDISGMVQASPYKRRIQTSAMSLASLCGNLAAFTIILLIRWVGVHIMSQNAAFIWSTLPAIGLMGLALSIMGALMYKFYILSIIVLAVVFGSAGGFINIAGSTEAGAGQNILGGIPVPAAIVLCVVMILLGNGIQYLITRMIYKRPFSKGAFGNAVGKKFV